METRRVSVDELVDGPVTGGGELFRRGTTSIDPVVVVDLGEPVSANEHIERAARRARASGVILLGESRRPINDAMTPLVTALDLTYAPESNHRGVIAVGDVTETVAGFLDATAQCPTAALVAAQVVRTSEPLEPIPAIDVESLAYSTLQTGPEFARWLTARRAKNRPLPPRVLDPVLLDRRNDTLRITLNRPERRNAYGTGLRDALVEALRVPLFDETIRRVILDGAGSSFCAGGDLDEFGHMPDGATAHLIRTRGGAGRLIAALADRVEVRLHGHCVGAGIEIPAFANRVVARSDTRLRLPEVAMGLIPGAGGTVSVPRRIGRWRALHLFVTGAEIDATQALSWGLVDAIED